MTLVLTLKRFNQAGLSQAMQKLDTQVWFPKELKLRGVVGRSEPPEYRLRGIVVHEGISIEDGHYIAFVRNGEGDEWWRMSDTNCRRVSAEETLQQKAYMLFYEQQN